MPEKSSRVQSGNATNWREVLSKTHGEAMFADMGSQNIDLANKAIVVRLFCRASSLYRPCTNRKLMSVTAKSMKQTGESYEEQSDQLSVVSQY